MHNLREIRQLLRDYPRLQALREAGGNVGYDIACVLLDLEIAIRSVRITERQSEVLRLLYEEGLTQTEAGERLGITQQAVEQAEKAALRKIQREYKRGAGK